MLVGRRLRAFCALERPRPWLAGVCRRVVANDRRTRRRQRARETRFFEVTASSQTEDRRTRWELRAELLTWIDTLPRLQREALLGVGLQGYSAPEFAALIGCSANTVNSRLRLARAKLQRLAQATGVK